MSILRIDNFKIIKLKTKNDAELLIKTFIMYVDTKLLRKVEVNNEKYLNFRQFSVRKKLCHCIAFFQNQKYFEKFEIIQFNVAVIIKTFFIGKINVNVYQSQ